MKILVSSYKLRLLLGRFPFLDAKHKLTVFNVIIRNKLMIKERVNNMPFEVLNKEFCPGANALRPICLVWGYKKFSASLQRYADNKGLVCWYMEDGFVRSFDLLQKATAPLGVLLDKKGVYYDAGFSCELEQFLNNESLTQDRREITEGCMTLLKLNRLSKYNAIDVKQLQDAVDERCGYGMCYGENQSVLIVDQVMGDASIEYGMANQDSFDEMLKKALTDNPSSNILIKTHPDVLSAHGKQGYIDLKKANKHERVQIIPERVNPWDLFAQVDKVYTVTSQMGFEALIAGKEVHCFGMPFYAGWGLTHDRLVCERRVKKRSVEDIFYFAYIKYARYVNPFLKKRTDLKEACHIIVDQRRHAQAHLYHHVCLGFSPWKKRFVADFVRLRDVTRLKFVSDIKHIPASAKALSNINNFQRIYFRVHDIARALIGRDPIKRAHTDVRFANLPVRVLVWSSSDYAQTLRESKANNKNDLAYGVAFMEDGFLRSVGLGADLARPCSLVVDTQGIYYDATRTSDLECLLEEHDFFESDLSRAKALRESLLELRLSKYNVSESAVEKLDEINGRKIILVPAQVEDDASIRFGCKDINTNLSLLHAVREKNPDAFIVYKPHPDVLLSGRLGMQQESELLKCCDHVTQGGSIIDWIERVDEVHTMTSLAGFEALLRNKKVFCYGMPFYAGWGLTEDGYDCVRRKRTRSLDELVAASLIYYPIYVDPVTKQVCNVETIVQLLANNLEKPYRPDLKTRITRKVQRWRNA